MGRFWARCNLGFDRKPRSITTVTDLWAYIGTQNGVARARSDRNARVRLGNRSGATFESLTAHYALAHDQAKQCGPALPPR
jgi:hypothetical protein